MSQADWVTTKVEKIEKQKDTYLLLTLKVPSHFEHKAGQYTVMRIKDDQGEFKAYYSIASAPSKDNLVDFCIIWQQNPRLARFFNGLKANDSVSLLPAATQTFDMSLVKGASVFLAGGSGIAPLRAMIQNLHANGAKAPVRLLYGCQSALEIPFMEDFLQMEEDHADFSAYFCAERDEKEKVTKGRIDALLADVALSDADYFMCGPPKMLENLKSQLAGLGVPLERIFVEGH